MESNQEEYHQALSYYGLPLNYKRVFTPTNAGLALCDPAKDAPAWVQANPSPDNFPLKKAKLEDISVLQNVTLDFEYPKEPNQAHIVGEALEMFIYNLFGIHTNVEDSGAGCHITIPIKPIEIPPGEQKKINDIVHSIVKEKINPFFIKACEQLGIEMKLEAFNIDRIISLPGTWRPWSAKDDKHESAEFLKAGYLRTWLTPYVEREESEKLRNLILEYYNRDDQPVVKNEPVSAPNPKLEIVHGFNTEPNQEEVINFILRKANEHPKGADRSAWFQSVVNAFYLKYGRDESLLSQYALDIDNATGGKYGSRAVKEALRSLDAADRALVREDTPTTWEGKFSARLSELKPNLSNEPAPEQPKKKRLLSVAELCKLPPAEFLVDNELVKNSFAFLVGEPGSKKSFIALDYARKVCEQGGNVIFVAGEGVGGLSKRVEAYKTHFECDLEGLMFWPEALELHKPEACADFLSEIIDLEPDLIILDTLARCAVGLDENSAKDMGLFIFACDSLRRKTEACVLVIHHTTKNGGSERGSSALKGSADTMIKVTTENDATKITCEKQKDSEPFQDHFVMWQQVGESIVPISTSSYETVDTENLSKNSKAVLEALNNPLFEKGATWRKLCEVMGWETTNSKKATLYKLLGSLIKSDHVAKTGNGEPFYITQRGKNTLAGTIEQPILWNSSKSSISSIATKIATDKPTTIEVTKLEKIEPQPSREQLQELVAQGVGIVPIYRTDNRGFCTCSVGQLCTNPNSHRLTKTEFTTDPEQVNGWYKAFSNNHDFAKVVKKPKFEVIFGDSEELGELDAS